MLSLLTRKKRFGDPWIGHPRLNQGFALHRRRMQLAEALCCWRRWLVAPQGVAPGASPLLASVLGALARDGCVQIPNFLPASSFAALREEVDQAVAATVGRATSASGPSLAASTASMAAPSTAFWRSSPPPCRRPRRSVPIPGSPPVRAP